MIRPLRPTRILKELRAYPVPGGWRGDRGAAVQSAVTLLLLVSLTLGMLLYIFGYVVPPGAMGVRQITFGPGQGFSRAGLSPGYHWSVPTYSTIHIVPRTTQIIDMHRDGGGSAALEIQTADRATVDVDISILARFYSEPGEEARDGGEKRAHGGPADLLQRIGLARERWENHIRRTADDQLKRTLGKLSTPEFYNPFRREEQIRVAHRALNEILARDGIRIEAVLLRRYTYRDERIDNAIFQKNLQDQEERLNSAAGTFAAAQATLEQVAAEWDAKIETLRVEGTNKARVIRSEGTLYESERMAVADLLVAKARAEVDRLRAGALAQSEGARIHVAREMAPLLGSLRGGIVSDVDPYDMNGWMRKLGVQR